MTDYPRRAPNHSKTAWVDIKIDFMSVGDAWFWDQQIQPDIRAEHVQSLLSGGPPRADYYWQWTGLRLLFPLSQWLQNRRCRALAVFVQNDQGEAVPAGMLLLIEQYPWPLPAAGSGDSTFTWFLATAPKATLQRLGVPDPPSVGRILIDTALVTSETLGLNGRMWLHAAPVGGPWLMTYYTKKCGLLPMAAGTRLPWFQVSDGRHFYATAALASTLMSALNITR
jgi:hypothetical protein